MEPKKVWLLCLRFEPYSTSVSVVHLLGESDSDESELMNRGGDCCVVVSAIIIW